MKKIFLIAICFLVTTIANATVITSTTSGGDWNTTTTWVGGIIPGATDSVIIAQRAGVTVNGNNTCARLTVNGQTSGFGNFPTWVGPIFGNTLTVIGDIVLNGGSSDARPAQLLIDDNATANVNGDIICNATTGFRAQIDMSFGNGKLNIQGTIILSTEGGILSSSTSTINLNGASSQTLTMGSQLVYNHITLNNSGTAITLGGAITTSNVTGNITVQSGIFDNGGFAIAGVSTDTFKVSTGTTFILTGTSGFPTGFTHTLETSSTVQYSGTTQTVSMPSTPYYNLTISNTGTKTLGAAIDVNGVLTINTGATLDAGVSNFNINLAGNLINSGTMNNQSNTFTFDGTTSISGSSTNSFNNITISGTLTAPGANFNAAGNWANNGTFTHNSGTVTFNGTTTISGSSATAFNNITISGSLTASIGTSSVAGNWVNNGTFTHNGGTINFNGTTALSGTSLSSFKNITISGTLTGVSFGNFNVAGNWNKTGTYNPNNGKVTFNGTGAQTITNSSGVLFNDLTINSTGPLSLSGNASVSSILTMTSGNISTSTDTLTLGTSTSNQGTLTRTSGTIIGRFQRWINTTSSDFLFPVGMTSVYRPSIITFNTLTGGTLTGEFIGTNPGSLGLPLADPQPDSIYNQFTEGYWAMTPANGLSSTNYNLKVVGTGFISYTLGSATHLMTRSSGGSPWTASGTHVTAVPDTAKRNSVSVLPAQYGLGNICNPPVVNLGPDATVCDSVLLDAGNCCTATYLWSTGATTQTIYASQPGLNLYWAEVTASGCGSARDTINVTVNTTPIVNLGPDASVCDSVLLDAGNPGASYIWSTSATTQTIYASSTGTYWVDVTNNGCTKRDSIVLTVNTSPTVNLGPDNTVCDSVLLDAGNPGASFVWSTSATTQTIYASSTGTYWVDVTNNGCTKRDSIVVTVNTSPIVNLGPDNTVCDSVLLDAGNCCTATYLWSTSATTQTIYASSTGTYWAEVTLTGCPAVRDTVNITVNTSPTVNLGPDNTVCDSVLLDAGNPGASFVWSTSATTQTIYASSTGTYWVDVTNNGCTKRDSIVVTVNTSPTVNLGPDNTVCDSVLLDAGNCCTATYLWSTSATTQTIYASSTGTYWAEVTLTGCPAVRDTVNITVNTSPTVNLGPDNTVCDSVLLDAGNPGASFVWSTSATTQTIYASSTGTYWVDVTNNGCTKRDSIVVTVNTSPIVNLGPDNTVCDSVLLDAGNCCTATYLWSTSATTRTIYASSTGTYWVDVTNSGCPTKRDTIIVTVNASPVVNLGPDATVCDSVLLNAGNCCTATYLWSTSATTQIIYASSTGTYWVDVTNNSCTKRDSIVVDVHPVATSPITGNTPVFQSTTHTYSVTLTPGYTYTWSLLQSRGTIDAGQGSNSITVTWNTTGTDTVRCVADSCGTAAPVDLQVVINGVITSSTTDFWDLGTTWTGGVAPTATDSVVIAAGTEVTVRTSSAASASVSINAVGFSTAVITVQSGQTLAISGNVNMNGSNDVPAVIQLMGTGTLNVTGNINMNVSTADKARIIMTDGASTLNLNGNINLSSVGTLSSSATSTININGSSAQTLAMGSALVYNHINMNNSASTVTLNSAITGTNVTGNIKILSGTFDNGGFSIASAGGGTDTFQVNNIATFMLMGTTGWPTGFRDVLGSTIVYGGGNQTVTMPNNGQVYDTLVIAGTGTKTLGENITVNGQLRINPTGVTLDASASNFNLNLRGQFRNNGTFNARGGTVIFEGTSAQTVDGGTLTAFNNLTINNTMGGVTLSTAQQVTGTLTLTSGTLTTGGNLTLISNSSGTARIGQVTGGAMSGNFTMQRLIPAVPDWRLLSPSVAGATIGDWNGEIPMSCIGGAPHTTPHFTSVYTYDETVGGPQANGFSADDDPGPAGVSLTDAATTGRGYFIWAGTCLPPCSPATITTGLTGTLVSGTQTISCSFTASGGDTEDGWNLIGNPFPSDFSWDAAASTGGVTGIAYVYDPATNGYLELNRVLPSDRDVIPSQQGFWAKASGSGGSVVIEEADKVADGMNFLKVGNNPPGFTLTLDGNGFTDITEFYFYPGATVNYDAPIDALKINSLNYQVANLSSVSADSVGLAQNFLPEQIQDYSIPLNITWIWPGGSNNYTISANDLSALPLSTCIVLEDITTGIFTNLRVDTSYTFTMTADTTSAPPRFLLHIGAPVAKEITNVSCNGASDGMAVVTGQGSGPWSYVWLNSNGDTIRASQNINSSDTLSGVPSGTYRVFVTNTGALCNQVIDTIDINEPAVLSANITATDVGCNGGSNGTAAVAAAGGSTPYTYLWNDSSLQTTPTATGLSAGNYSVTITDNNGCVQTANATVNEPAAITATISKTDVSCNGGSNGTAAAAAAGGSPPYNYLWNDPAATTADTAANLPAGNYSVTITDNNGCVQTANTTINEPLVVIANLSVNADTIYLSQGGTVQFTNNSSGASSYEWDFGDGVKSYDQSPWHNYGSTGNYIIKLIAANANMCYDSVNYQITVLDYPVGVIEPDYPEESSIQFLQNQNGVFIEFNLKKITEVKISLYNLLGQKVTEDRNINVQNDRIKINLFNKPRGIYFVKVEADGQSITGKIISH